jgi:hypothetical protein
MSMATTIRNFKLGKIIPTKRVVDIIMDSKDYQEWVEYCLGRYASRDWGGSMGTEDRTHNDRAVKNKERVIARYSNPKGNIVILTEEGSTTVLLQDEY